MRIAALDAAAEARGLRRGQGLADARAAHPDLDIVPADADADRRLLVAIADWCDRYTPLVALDAPDGLFLDITGCAHLFGGEHTASRRPDGAALRTGFRRAGGDRRDAGRGLGGGAPLRTFRCVSTGARRRPCSPLFRWPRCGLTAKRWPALPRSD
jgi:hypothetical protein